MKTLKRTMVALGMCALVGCGGSSTADGGSESFDGGRADAGGSSDAGARDAGSRDAGDVDAGATDAGVDAATDDAEVGDAGPADGGVPTWSVEVVGPVSGSEHYTALAAQHGNVHVLYFDPGGRDLEHAWLPAAATTWSHETVDEAGFTGWYPSAALDSTGRLHAFFHRFSPDVDVAHAVRSTSGAWTLAAVDGPHAVGWTVRGTVDEADRLHAAYMDDTDGDLRYALDAGSGWVIEDVPSSADLAVLALAARGSTVSVLAVRDAGGVVLLERSPTGDWTREDVHSSTPTAIGDGLAVDASGRLHACFDSDAGVRYARREVGGWTHEVLAPGGGASLDCAVAIDAAGRPHVAYSAPSSRHLGHAVLDGAWMHETIDTVESWAPSIAIDGDVIHVGYVARAGGGSSVKRAVLR